MVGGWLNCAVALLAIHSTIGGTSLSRTELRQKALPVEYPKFDASRAWVDLLTQVSFGPRVPGTEAQIKCRDYLTAELKKSCDSVEQQEFEHTWSKSGKSLKMWNVLGYQNWKTAKTRVALIAHWDSRAQADQDIPENREMPIPGANDGASGVAVILELARVLKETKPEVGVMYVLTDGEDLGPGEDEMYLGAIKFAKNQPTVRANYGILLDMIGSKTQRIPIERNSLQIAGDLVRALYSHAAKIGLSKAFPMEQGWDIDDDHLPITKEGLKTIDLIDFDYRPYWHTINDTADKCSPEALGNVGKLLQSWLELKPAYTFKG